MNELQLQFQSGTAILPLVQERFGGARGGAEADLRRPAGALNAKISPFRFSKFRNLVFCLFLAAGLLTSEGVVGRLQAQDMPTRAEEWRVLRLRKLQNIIPPEVSGFEKALLYLEERGFEKLLTVRWNDLYPQFGTLSSGSGLAPGIRYFKSGLTKWDLTAESSAAVSFSGYRQVDLQFGGFDRIAPHVFLGPAELGSPFQFGEETTARRQLFLYGDLRYRHFPQEDFFGVGPESRVQDRTDFLLEDAAYDLVGGLQINRRIGFVARAGYLQVDIDRGGDDRFPDTIDVFDPSTTPGLLRQPDFVHFDSALYLDYRDRPGNPHRGGVLAFSFSRFDDRGGEDFEFNRYSLDARYYLPLGSRQRTLAARFFTSVDDSDVGSRTPFFLQRTLGGNEALRGFREFRFRDDGQIYLSSEYRWEAVPALEFALFYEAGKVFPEAASYDFKGLETSYGGGVRFKTAGRVIIRFDVGHSREGTRFFLRFGPSF